MKYFVSGVSADGRAFSAEVERTGPIRTATDVREIEEKLDDQRTATGPYYILNWRRFEEPAPDRAHVFAAALVQIARGVENPQELAQKALEVA